LHGIDRHAEVSQRASGKFNLGFIRSNDQVVAFFRSNLGKLETDA
jgi:hypothetical protein